MIEVKDPIDRKQAILVLSVCARRLDTGEGEERRGGRRWSKSSGVVAGESWRVSTEAVPLDDSYMGFQHWAQSQSTKFGNHWISPFWLWWERVSCWLRVIYKRHTWHMRADRIGKSWTRVCDVITNPLAMWETRLHNW